MPPQRCLARSLRLLDCDNQTIWERSIVVEEPDDPQSARNTNPINQFWTAAGDVLIEIVKRQLDIPGEGFEKAFATLKVTAPGARASARFAWPGGRSPKASCFFDQRGVYCAGAKA
jgi:hypothetical protein